jgi:uncharacterized protein (TIGR04552 family)
VPGESLNQLVDLGELLYAQAMADPEERAHAAARSALGLSLNEFSGPDYRIINFVTDLPLRVDRLLAKREIPPDLSHVIFVLTEFQIADKATALQNESGASSHEAYKARQHERVRMRLFRDKDDPLPPD